MKKVFCILAVIGLLSAAVLSAQADPTVVNGSNASDKGWTSTIGTGSSISWVNGPGATPLGFGSLEISAPTGGKVMVKTTAGNGLNLNQLTSLSYSTYIDTRSSGTSVAPALAIQVKTSFFTTKVLTFEPTYVSNGTLVDQWQTWDALTSKKAWWVSGAQNTFLSWTDILDSYGTKALSSNGIWLQVGQNSGGAPWSGFTGYVDNVIINSNVYDFESLKPVNQAAAVPEPATLLGFGIPMLMVGLGKLRSLKK